MGGVVNPVLGDIGVAVDADVGGCTVGEGESSGPGQQQRSCRAAHRHIDLLDSGPQRCPSGRRSTNQAPASFAVSVARNCRVCPVPGMARANSDRRISHAAEMSSSCDEIGGAQPSN